MQFEICAGYINFSLDWTDWKIGGPKFIEELKKRIPLEDRSYDPDNYIWTVKKEYLEIIRELRKEYLADKNQKELF